MYDFRNNHLQRTIELETAVYHQMLTQYAQLMSAYTEGVFEVTVRSQHQTVTIPVPFGTGASVAADIADFFVKRIGLVEADLNSCIEESTVEVRQEVAQQLAQQAAAPAPKQPVGRPRKSSVKPQPEVLQGVGQAAAQVPMNGSTAHAVGRAVGQPTA